MLGGLDGRISSNVPGHIAVYAAGLPFLRFDEGTGAVVAVGMSVVGAATVAAGNSSRGSISLRMAVL